MWPMIVVGVLISLVVGAALGLLHLWMAKKNLAQA